MTNVTEYYRKCSGCGRGMNEGYLGDYQYFCSDKFLNIVYTPEQWTGLYDGDQNDDFYWTEWEEKSYEDDGVYDAAGNIIKGGGMNYEYYTSYRSGTPFRPVRAHTPLAGQVLIAGQLLLVIICGWAVLA